MTTGKYAETPSVDPLHCNVLEHFEQIRTLHVAAAIGSGSLFLLRGLAMLAGSGLGMAAPVRYLSYAIDSVLLGAAIALATMLRLVPLVDPWITAKVGLVPMDRIWDLGFRQITNSIKPIKSAADLDGMKLRVPGAPALVSLFKSLGTHPVSMQFGEVYTSLQTKVVDGQENPMSIIDAGKFYEVQKYCSITNHVWDGHWITFNKAAWDRLPDDLKTVVARAFNEGAVAQRAELAKMNDTLQAELEKK